MKERRWRWRCPRVMQDGGEWPHGVQDEGVADPPTPPSSRQGRGRSDRNAECAVVLVLIRQPDSRRGGARRRSRDVARDARLRGEAASKRCIPPRRSYKIPQLQDSKFHNSASIDAFGYKLQSVDSTPSNSANVIAGPEKARFKSPRLETRLASLAEPGDLS